MLKRIRHCIGNAVVDRVRRRLEQVDSKELREWIVPLIRRRASSLTPAEALRFLLEMETSLRRAMDAEAIRLDGGVHAKHRLTHYHDFFAKRIQASDAVLDVGCGSGAVAHAVAVATGASVTAMDLLAGCIEEAQRRFPHSRVRYLQGDVTRDLPRERFDVAMLSNVLEHIVDRPGLLKAIQRETGCSRFLIRVPVRDRDWLVPLRRELGLDDRLDATHQTEYTAESFAGEIADAGLKIVEQHFRWGEIWAECVVKV